MQHPVHVILHNIRSAHNVGSVFRTADAAGVSKIFLTGYTPLPVDRFSRKRNDVAKAALGAQDQVPWEYCRHASVAIERLRSEGVSIVGVEQDPSAQNYTSHTLEGATAFLFGNEVRGISKTLRKRCDALVEIELSGTKESLNVAVTAGIILFAMRDINTK